MRLALDFGVYPGNRGEREVALPPRPVFDVTICDLKPQGQDEGNAAPEGWGLDEVFVFLVLGEAFDEFFHFLGLAFVREEGGVVGLDEDRVS